MEKPVSEYHRQSSTKIKAACKVCSAVQFKKYVVENAELISQRTKQRRKENPEAFLTRAAAHRKANPARYRKYVADRRAMLLQATPKWADQEAIARMYYKADYIQRKSGILQNVDHVITLQNDFVCGLHVHTNMQVLTASANFSKSNKFSVDDDNVYYPPSKIIYTLKEFKPNGYKYKKSQRSC